MKLVCGLLRLDGGPADPAAVAAMARAMSPPDLATPVFGVATDGPAGLAVLRFGGGDAPEAPLVAANGDILASDLRLDRPREAAVALGLPPGEAPEAVALAGVRRWGDALPDRLDGDYALAAWDAGARRLTLARDIFGVRPLSTALLPGRLFAFASLPKGLHGSGLVPARPDLVALGRKVVGIYSQSQATGYLDIAWLAAGHVMTVEAGGATRLARGWTPDPATVGRWRGSHREAAEILRTLIREAVETRLPAAGGVAAHVSGGLDSSAVAVFAARALAASGRRLAAIAFLPPPGSASAEAADRPLVEALLAQEPSIDCAETHIVRQDFLADLDPDTPVAGHELANHARACAIAARAGARVLLTGAGGDEGATYNGAHIHADLLRAGRWRALGADLPARARREKRPLSRVILQRLVRPALPAALVSAEARLRGLKLSPPRTSGLDMLAPDLRRAVAESLAAGPLLRTNSPEDRVALFRDGFLPHRNTVWAAIGARQGLAFAHPLLDRRVVDFALGLPLERFLHAGHSRQPFRDAMEGVLPDVVRFAGAKGGALPEAPQALTAAGPALRDQAAALRKAPGAAAMFEVEAIEGAFAALPPDGDAVGIVVLRRAAAASRALSLWRGLARLEGPSRVGDAMGSDKLDAAAETA